MHLRPAIREALAAHEGLRRLGFPPEDIFLRPQTIKKGIHLIHVHLRVQGHEFNIAVAAFDGEEDELQKQWEKAVTWWNTEATDAQLDEIWSSSMMYRNGQELVAQLLSRGIKIPAIDGGTLACIKN